MKKLLLSLLFIIPITVANGQGNLPDTLKKTPLAIQDSVKASQVRPKSLILPGSLILYGALSFAVQPIRNFDYHIQSEVTKNNPNFSTKVDNYLPFTPIAIVYGLNLAGVEGQHRFADRTALLGISGAIFGLTTRPTKKLTHRLRPNGVDYLSFPSGHTSFAFMAAEFLAQEYGDKSPWYSVLGYSIATTTGVLRIYNNDHWVSDVVAGAGFGILSTRVAYLIYPTVKKWVTHGDKKTGKYTMIIPTYQDGVPGLSLSMGF